MTERLTANQRETLRVLGNVGWYEAKDCADEYRRTFRSLFRRGLLQRRGGAFGKPLEVALTDDGWRLLDATRGDHD